MDRPRLISDEFKWLSKLEAESLILPFTRGEIEAAVWECGGNKAPGPDGFNFNFFKRFWSLLEVDVKEVIQFYHGGGPVSPGCNATFITLIAKVVDPLSPMDLCPISLISCLRKITSKAMANRLKKVIDRVVGVEYKAFMVGRNILDGPLIVNESLAWLKTAKRKALVFKVDFKKAYDMVNWGFLEDIMEQMGFPVKWSAGLELSIVG